jgi:predicted RNA-binding Zn-ribbon protein involved in translation (DUF1610 family)
MPKTDFSPSIESRPVYPGLTPHGACPAIIVADEHGCEALLDLAASDPSAMDRAQLLLIGVPPVMAGRIAALKARTLAHAPDAQAASGLIDKLLAGAHMGTVLYLAGSEGLIGRVSAQALAAGLPDDAIEREHRGPIGRRMQCVHCKGITEDVLTDPFTCAHCGLTLFVRDHFSRRLGAFQGVCVDAETPGIIPPTEEIRP